MKNKQTLPQLIILSSSFLFILLFTYAGLSKAFDYETFRLQVSQSPILTAFAGPIAISTLLTEFAVVVLLAFERTRRAGLYGAFTLMAVFTVYIFLILNYSPYVPCSCGGILEDMDWNQHLYFNIAFLLLGAAALQAYVPNHQFGGKTAILSIGIFLLSGCGVTGLYLISETTLHEQNNFVRRIPSFVLYKMTDMQLGHDSYYFAGADKEYAYLGNYLTPSVLTRIDFNLKSKSTIRISLDDTVQNLDNARVKVVDSQFFVYDGKVPCVYSGTIGNWKAKLRINGVQRFTDLCPIDSVTAVFKAQTIKYGNLLGVFDLRDGGKAYYKHGILQKQLDGVFDTDGTMMYCSTSRKLLYTYFYRNQFIITDKDLILQSRGHTIDTTTRARIKVDSIKSKRQSKLAAPPVMVNRKTAVYRNLLFVNSSVPGKYDVERMWKKASVVDVYDLSNNNYILSFYINNLKESRMQNFIVVGDFLIVLYEKQISVFKINALLTKNYK